MVPGDSSTTRRSSPGSSCSGCARTERKPASSRGGVYTSVSSTCRQQIHSPGFGLIRI